MSTTPQYEIDFIADVPEGRHCAALIEAGQPTMTEAFLSYLVLPSGEMLHRYVEANGTKLLR